jgi:hypothetical protein
MTGLGGKEAAAVRRMLTMLAEQCVDGDATELDDIEKVDAIIDEWAERKQLEDRIDQLEAMIDVDGGKQSKVAKIVEYANKKSDSQQAVVKVTPREIKGATGVSRRYAYDLADDLPEEYPWIVTNEEMEQSQYGNLEKEVGDKCIGIDFEGVHGDRCPVNKFTTGTHSESGSTTQEVSEA